MLSTSIPNPYFDTENKPKNKWFSKRKLRTCFGKSKWLYLAIGALGVLCLVVFVYSLWLQHFIHYNKLKLAVNYTNNIGLYIGDDILLYKITKIHGPILRSWYLSGVETLMISKTAFDAVYNEIGQHLVHSMLELGHNLNISITLYVDDWCVLKVNHPGWKNVSDFYSNAQATNQNNSNFLVQPFMLDTDEYVFMERYTKSFEKYANFHITTFTFEPIATQYVNNQTLDKCNNISMERIKSLLTRYDNRVILLPTFELINDKLSIQNQLQYNHIDFNKLIVDVIEFNSTLESTLAVFEGYWKTLTNRTISNMKEFVPPAQLITRINRVPNTKNYVNQVIMAMFTPGDLILNAGDEVILSSTDNLTNYIDLVSNAIEDRAPIYQLVNIKKSFCKEYYKRNGFRMTKLALNDELVMFVRQISETSRLILLVNVKEVPINDVNVNQLIGENNAIEEILLTPSSTVTDENLGAYFNTTLNIGALESVLLLATLLS